MKNHVAVVKSNSALPAERTERERNYIHPSTDVYETTEAFVVMIDMPGAGRESLSVSVDSDTLTVKSAVGETDEGKPAVIMTELNRGGYYRSFHLGREIDRNNIDARYENGVLSLKLFKKEDAKPREISIH
jgi:HSP20 family protein